MDISKLNLASLKDKVANSLAAASKQNAKNASSNPQNKDSNGKSNKFDKFDRKNKPKDNRQSKFNDNNDNDNRRDNRSNVYQKKDSYNRSNDYQKKDSYNRSNDYQKKDSYNKSNDYQKKDSYNKSNDYQKKDSYSNKYDKKPRDFRKNDSNQKTSKSEPESEMDILRRDAFELGATEEDLKLIENIKINENQSEEEFGELDSKVDSKFTGDLSKLMKDIGLTNTKIPVVEDIPELVNGASKSEDEEENEEDEDNDDDEEEEEQEQEQEVQKSPEPKKHAKPEAKSEAKPEAKKEQQKESNKDKFANLQSVVTDRLVVPAITEWYTIPLKLKNSEKLSSSQIEQLYEQAKTIVEKENEIYYEEFNKSSSQKKFLSQILTSGTLSDKISALTLLIQEAPFHNIKALDNMFGMCEKKSRTAALQCINALTDLFINGILPPDRKLKYFNKQPLSLNLTPQQLALLYFEDYLKKMYFKFIGSLEKLSHDSIVHVRSKVVGHLFDLLKAKPEQEANLLRLGVNKLGDIENKVSSKASYQILQLEQQHPAMKQIVVEQVIDFLFRTNNEHTAIYYSVLGLNQTILTRKEEKLANKLVDAYFKLFEKQLIETDSLNVSKLKESDHQKIGKRKRNFKKGKKGGKSVKNDKTEEELSEEKNSKLFAAILTGLNRAYPFSNLPSEIFNSHLDILYKITHSTNFNTSVQALLLIHNITITQKGLTENNKDRFYRTLYESLLDSRLLTSSKQGIYLNLLFKALKEDENKDRVLTFVKRIVQICLGWLNVGTISGMLYLLIELEKSIPELRNLFYNTPMDDILNAKEEQEEEESDNENEDLKEEKKQVERVFYDPRKRDPKFANANKSSIWEINHFISHYHPTVALYAESLLEGPNSENKVSKPDLGLFSLSHFLDRFVYKNFKKNASTRGTSIMQPLGGSQTGSLLVRATGQNDRELPANTTDWISKKIGDIKPEDMFFYQYFSTKQEKIARSEYDKDIESKAQEDDDDNEEAEELDDDTVWNALVKSNPEVEGDEDELDDDLSDFDEADFDDLDDEDDDEPSVPNLENFDEDEDDEEELDDDGLVRLTTIEDLEGEDNEEDEEEEEEDGISSKHNELSDEDDDDDNDIQALLGEEDAELSDEEVISDEEDENSASEEDTRSRKRKSSEKEKLNSNKSKKLKLSSLPRFASAEDYAEYLQSSDEDDF